MLGGLFARVAFQHDSTTCELLQLAARIFGGFPRQSFGLQSLHIRESGQHTEWITPGDIRHSEIIQSTQSILTIEFDLFGTILEGNFQKNCTLFNQKKFSLVPGQVDCSLS